MKKHTFAPIVAGLSLVALINGAPAFAASPTASAGYSASQLVDFLLPAASAITVVSGSETFGTTASGGTTTSSAIGQFAGGDASNNLPFATGVVLTTGRLTGTANDDTGILGPNDRESTTHKWGNPGSSALETQMLLSPNSTSDAATLSFDFSTKSTGLSFQYMFASEEYAENVNSAYNDAFAFILTDLQTGQTWNLAKIGAQNVSVNTINNGLNNMGVGAQNSGYYSQNPEQGGTYDIEFDGMAGGNAANKLFASADWLVPTPNAQLNPYLYRIQMVIADVGNANIDISERDQSVDSAVFIGEDAFVDVPHNPVPEPSTYVGALALFGLIARKLRRKA